MILIYTTLNTTDETRQIARVLLERKLANCVNFFPITCMYNWENKITEEPEVVLIIKTKAGYFKKIENVIKQHIKYDNFIGEIPICTVNSSFESWLDSIVR